VIEKKMFSNTEDLLPVISFNAKASGDEQKKHQDFVDRMIDQGLHREAGAPAVRVVSARAQVVVIRECAIRPVPAGTPGALHGTRTPGGDMVRIIDRRFDSKNKSAVNRQRFMRRFKQQIRKAVSEAIHGRSIRDLENGEKCWYPRQGYFRAPFSAWQRWGARCRTSRQRPFPVR
jgi:hypothetical protein